jgi:thiol-disulfide isomerase/thioredoxin
MNAMVTNTRENLMELTHKQPVFLIFLRHFGCVFCKEALHDLSEKKEEFEAKGIRIVFVHMADNDVANEYFKNYGLKGVAHISDPGCNYYTAFGITKGTFSQLYGLRTWIRGFNAKRAGFELELSKNLGDSTQMPGIFSLHKGKIIQTFIHKRASDRPDYGSLIETADAASISQ